MALDEARFETLVNRTLDDLADTLDDVLGAHLDVERQGAVLTVTLDAGGQYVINKHAPSRQIWLSSPRSGALHFDYDEATERWRSTREGQDLLTLLAEELAAATGIPLAL